MPFALVSLILLGQYKTCFPGEYRPLLLVIDVKVNSEQVQLTPVLFPGYPRITGEGVAGADGIHEFQVLRNMNGSWRE